MIKLVVTDLDGTLFRDNKTYSEEFNNVVRQLKEKGVLFCVCSGRQLHNIQKYFDKDLNIIFSGNNGTHLIVEGEEIFKVLDKEEIKKITEITDQHKNLHLIGETKFGVVIEEAVPQKLVEELKHYCDNLQFVDSLKNCDEDMCKVTVCCKEGVELHALPKFEHLKETITVASSGDIWLDMMDLDGNKGNAVALIQEKLNIKPEETIVFGDHINDLEMLSMCPNSYAMKNAQDQAKECAKYVLEYTNNEDGVIKKIKELFELN